MAIGKNEALHDICAYEGRENLCPKDCKKCVCFIIREGDKAVSAGRIVDAIRQYKRAIFVEPLSPDAWNGLGHAYALKSEYNNAIDAFDKAILIDDEYGDALFGKAIALRNSGRIEDAIAVSEEILDLYDDDTVEAFQEELFNRESVKLPHTFSLDEAVRKMTLEAEHVIDANGLRNPNGSIDIEQAIYEKEQFTSSMFSYCQHRYASLGREKVWSEAIISSFYGSICATMLYYSGKNGIVNGSSFDYLKEHVNLEELDRNAEKFLGFRTGDAQSDALWNIIYPFITKCNRVISNIARESDVNAAVQDAAESAYVIGMAYAKRSHNKQSVVIRQPSPEEEEKFTKAGGPLFSMLASLSIDSRYTLKSDSSINDLIVESVLSLLSGKKTDDGKISAVIYYYKGAGNNEKTWVLEGGQVRLSKPGDILSVRPTGIGFDKTVYSITIENNSIEIGETFGPLFGRGAACDICNHDGIITFANPRRTWVS